MLFVLALLLSRRLRRLVVLAVGVLLVVYALSQVPWLVFPTVVFLGLAVAGRARRQAS
jgi:hypothetical protein